MVSFKWFLINNIYIYIYKHIYIYIYIYYYIHTYIYIYRVGGNGLTVLVLAGPVFLKVKMKFNFCKKQVINKSASVIFGLVRLIILR